MAVQPMFPKHHINTTLLMGVEEKGKDNTNHTTTFLLLVGTEWEASLAKQYFSISLPF